MLETFQFWAGRETWMLRKYVIHMFMIPRLKPWEHLHSLLVQRYALVYDHFWITCLFWGNDTLIFPVSFVILVLVDSSMLNCIYKYWGKWDSAVYVKFLVHGRFSKHICSPPFHYLCTLCFWVLAVASLFA